jgi:hypothetical protein
MIPAARSHSFRDIAAVMARRMYGWANLDKLLFARPVLPSDPRALCVRLVHDALQQALLAHDVERWCITRRKDAEYAGFAEPDAADSAAESRCMWMIVA